MHGDEGKGFGGIRHGSALGVPSYLSIKLLLPLLFTVLKVNNHIFIIYRNTTQHSVKTPHIGSVGLVYVRPTLRNKQVTLSCGSFTCVRYRLAVPPISSFWEQQRSPRHLQADYRTHLQPSLSLCSCDRCTVPRELVSIHEPEKELWNVTPQQQRSLVSQSRLTTPLDVPLWGACSLRITGQLQRCGSEGR